MGKALNERLPSRLFRGVDCEKFKIDKGLAPGKRGVSTTPFFDRARFYALANGRFAEGWVVEFAPWALNQLAVRIVRVARFVRAPALAEDDEHLLFTADFGDVPGAAVIRAHQVFATADCLFTCRGAPACDCPRCLAVRSVSPNR